MYEHSTYEISRRRDRNLRASDADREAFSERLRRHHADGRLSTDEFQDRIDTCYSAKTVGELERLVADLPAERPSGSRLAVRRMWAVPLIPIVLAIVLISLATGSHDHGFGFWVVIPFLFMLRLTYWGRYRRWGGWRGPEHQV